MMKGLSCRMLVYHLGKYNHLRQIYMPRTIFPHPLSPSTPPVSHPLTPFSDHSSEFDPETPQGMSEQNRPLEDNYLPATLLKILTSWFYQDAQGGYIAVQFSPKDLVEFLNPQEHTSVPSDDPVLGFSLQNFVSYMNTFQRAYTGCIKGVSEAVKCIENTREIINFIRVYLFGYF